MLNNKEMKELEAKAIDALPKIKGFMHFYRLDEDGNLWSMRSGKPERIKMSESSNGEFYRIFTSRNVYTRAYKDDLIELVYHGKAMPEVRCKKRLAKIEKEEEMARVDKLSKIKGFQSKYRVEEDGTVYSLLTDKARKLQPMYDEKTKSNFYRLRMTGGRMKKVFTEDLIKYVFQDVPIPRPKKGGNNVEGFNGKTKVNNAPKKKIVSVFGMSYDLNAI